MPKQNLLSPEFGTKVQRQVPLILEIPEFPFNTVQDGWKKAPMPKPSRRFDRTPICDRQTQTDGQTHGHG